MRFLPLSLILLSFLSNNPAVSQSPDLLHDKIGAVVAHFTSLNIPDLEKLQIPQAQPDGSYVFIYVWFPKTHRPAPAYFEANVADYFDVAGARSTAFIGWCYLKTPEKLVLKTHTNEVGVVRIWALGFQGRAPRRRRRGGFPGEAGRLGQTQVYRDPNSGLLSMVRSGHPTRFPATEEGLD
jgi:hypothetical protein